MYKISKMRRKTRQFACLLILPGVLIVVYFRWLKGPMSKGRFESDLEGRQLIFTELGKPWVTNVDKVDDEDLHPNGQNQTSSHWPVLENDLKGRQLIFSELGKPWATYVDKVDDEDLHPNGQNQTSDHWPVFSKPYFKHDIPRSPYRPTHIIKWNFDTAAFLEKPHVKGKPPKLITWMEIYRSAQMPLPEVVRLRMCPEMPCRLTTNVTWWRESAALIWNAQTMKDPKPPPRAHPDQVFVIHNHEPQHKRWGKLSMYRTEAWNNQFNWTWFYRTDSDVPYLHSYLVRRHTPVTKDFSRLVAEKTGQAAWMVSNCHPSSRRHEYVGELQKYYSVDVYGRCGKRKCPRTKDDECTDLVSRKYRYYLSFENNFCTDYITPKFFRFYNRDIIPIVRGSNEYRFHAPEGTYINTADFASPKDLADYLKHLDSHPDEYEAILRRKAQWIALLEDWPTRSESGEIIWISFHFMSLGYCEMCRRLWELDSHRKSVANMGRWIDKGNCREPDDMGWANKKH